MSIKMTKFTYNFIWTSVVEERKTPDLYLSTLLYIVHYMQLRSLVLLFANE